MREETIIYTENCVGCRACELACSYHHRQIFPRKITSIEVQRKGREGKFGIILYRQAKDGRMACDCAEGKELCLNYCPPIAHDELKVILKRKER